MANARPPGGISGGPTGNAPNLRIPVDLSALRAMPGAAREASQATTREISQAFRALQNEQRLAVEQARQATVSLRAEGQVRAQAARAESVERQQAARAAANTSIEAEKRVTAQVKAEINERARAQRQAQVFTQGAATFAGAAFGGPIGGIAGALAGGGGLALGAGLLTRELVSQGAQAVQAASDLTESINKAGVAFGQSQRQILAWSETSSTALGQSQQQALEAASSFGLLFSQMGVTSAKSAEMSQRLVELAADIASINNIRPEDALEKLRAGLVGEVRPLRDVGILLNDEVVTQKAVALGFAQTTNAVTDQQKVMARYALILEQTSLTQGDFARTSGELANQQRILAARWTDLRAAMGQELKPSVATAISALNELIGLLDKAIEKRQKLNEEANRVGNAALQQYLAETGRGPSFVGRVPSWMTSATGNANPSRIPSPYSDEQRSAQLDAKVNRFNQLNDIQRNEVNSILDTERQINRQRINLESSYQTQTLREAQDFARQRLNAERKFNLSLLDVAQDSARQRAKWEADTARNIAQARADSADKVAEIERDYQRDRIKRERAYRDSLIDAAGRLDAKAVAEAQRNFKRQEEDAKEAHDDRLKSEADSLEKSIRQQQEANQRRIDEQKENDRLRIEEMKAAFEEQKAQEDIERDIRLDRQAVDHQKQLDELERQEGERIQQIKDHAARDRQQVEDEFQDAMIQAGVHLKAREAYLKQVEKLAEDSFDRVYGHMLSRFNAPVQGPAQRLPIPQLNPGGTNAPATPYSFPQLSPTGQGYIYPGAQASSAGGVTIGTIAPTVIIGDTGGRSDEYIIGLVRRGIVEALNEAAA